MEQREDGGVGTDAERQRQDGDDGEPELLPQMPKRQPDVAPKIAHDASPAVRRSGTAVVGTDVRLKPDSTRRAARSPD